MRERHVIRQHYEALEKGKATPEALDRRFREHVLEICPVCDGELLAYLHERRPGLLHLTVLLILLRRVAEEVRRLEEQARHELAELMKTSPADRLGRVRRARKRFRNPLLADLLIESSRQRVFADPRESLAFARLAFEVAVRIGMQGPGGTDLAHEPMTRAKAYEANALRAGGDLKAAERPMANALANVGKLERPEAQAEIVSLAASLRRCQRRFEEALRLVDLAIQLDAEAGDEHQVAKRLILKSHTLFELGRIEQAIGAVQKALERLDRQRDLFLYVVAEHALLCYLVDAGYVAEARKRFEEAQGFYDSFEGEWSLQVRRRWLEGNIARGFGETEQAEHSLTAARDSFLERGIGLDAALVSLDLARLYEDQGRLDDLQEQAEAALPVLRSMDFHREAAAAVALLVKAGSRAQPAGVS